MTESEVSDILTVQMGVSRETLKMLQTLVALVIAENRNQNLIASGSEASIWDRHILDSAQLYGLAPAHSGCWLDVGTGAGFPGLVLAAMTNSEHVLVEPRRKRAEFLTRAVDALGLMDRVHVIRTPVEKIVRPPVDVITARAVASLDKLLGATRQLAGPSTVWLLHKGRSAQAEIDEVGRRWSASFQMLPSLTDRDAAIVHVRDLRGVAAS